MSWDGADVQQSATLRHSLLCYGVVCSAMVCSVMPSFWGSQTRHEPRTQHKLLGASGSN